MANQITVTVTGQAGVGKTTVAALIANYLRTVGFSRVQLELLDNEMPPCPTETRKRTMSIQDVGTEITVTERQVGRGPVNF